MTYEEFLEKLKDEIAERLSIRKDTMRFYKKGCIPDNEVDRANIRKENRSCEGIESDAALLNTLYIDFPAIDGITHAVSLNTSALYERYLKSSFEAVIEYIFEADKSNLNLESIKARLADDYEAVKPFLIIRLLSMEIHGDDLKRSKSVYLEFGDIAIVLYQLLGDGEMYSTSRIYESDMERWNVLEDMPKVLAEACINTSQLYPAIIYNPHTGSPMDVLREAFSREDFLVKGAGFLTAKGTPNGAAALFYPNVRRRIAEIMGGAFLAVFLNTMDIEILQIGSPMLDHALRLARSNTPFGEQLSSMVFLCTADEYHPQAAFHDKTNNIDIYPIHVNGEFVSYKDDNSD